MTKQKRRARGSPYAPGFLAPQTKLFDELAIALVVFLHQILEQTTSFAYHHEKTATAVKIFGMALEVLGQLINALSEQGYLYFRRTGIFSIDLVAGDDFLFALC